MLDNILPREKLKKVFARQRRGVVEKSVPHSKVDAYLAKGWRVKKRHHTLTRLQRPKEISEQLESRVWSLMYSLGFPLLSGDGGARLSVNPSDESTTKKQLDVVAIDDEVALCIECKSLRVRSRDQQFPPKIDALAENRVRFIRTVEQAFPVEEKRHTAMVLFTQNIDLRDVDMQRAKDQNVVLFNEDDLSYFEALAKHVVGGPAARYQFLAHVVRGRRIPGLKVTVPAMRTSVGEYECFMFAIEPHYLLKIATVARRSRGIAASLDAYQRLVSRTRLRKIGNYISNNGVFPTNIVINVETDHVQFDRGEQAANDTAVRFGWLTISPSYGTAWIIDGQHRLLGYSGHPRAKTSYLSVLAFIGLPARRQTELFIDINSEQKKVKRNLIEELRATTDWDADADTDRARAILSRAVQQLNDDQGSPFYARILRENEQKTTERCITLNAFLSLLKPGMFVVRSNVEYGPFWAGDSEATLGRTKAILNSWFSAVRDGAEDWWELGRDSTGGGLAMNDGVTICVGILRDVLDHLDDVGGKLIKMDTENVLDALAPYASALSEYLGTLDETQRRAFKENGRGNQGQSRLKSQCERAMHERLPQFAPRAVMEELRLIEARTNDQARPLIEDTIVAIKHIVLTRLREQFGDDWWREGVKQDIRVKAASRREQDDIEAALEGYLDLMDYREVIQEHWDSLFADVGYGSRQGKKYRTSWLVHLNRLRNVVAHPEKEILITMEELDAIREYHAHIEHVEPGA